MLNEHGRTFTYRDTTKMPLSEPELRDVLGKLGVGPRDVLRSRDATKAGLSGDESDDQLIALMAENPRLVQRPIAVTHDTA
ncbi:MAG: arsenate reductase, partial [bacterium]